MDLFTHFFIPYIVMTLLRRRQAERLAAGLGGWAPDFDTLVAWTSIPFPGLYWLGHRGLSHSALGAPLFALVVMAIVALPPWHKKWPRMAVWQFTPRLVTIAMVASFTHLALDYLTIWGIPLAYPFSVERVSSNWFFYSVSLAFLVSGYGCYRLARGTSNDALVKKLAVALVAAFLLAGTVRYATHPDLPHGALTQPGSQEWTWTTYTRNETGWEVGYWSWGSLTHTRFYNASNATDPAAAAALEHAMGSDEYRAWRLYAWGPIAPQLEETPEGTWNVTFLDLTRRAQADDRPGWFPRIREAGMLRFQLTAEGLRLVDD